jgi:homoserine dehydrogenase
MGDVIDAARAVDMNRERGVERWGGVVPGIGPQIVPLSEISLPVYLRFQVPDRPGTLGRIATVLGNFDISIDSMDQPRYHPVDHVPIYFTTQAAPLGKIEKALAEIEALGFLATRPLWMPILEK